VAAGTGKLARQLQAAGARTVAVEPSASMRAEGRRASPSTAVVAGSAEALPFSTGTFDLVAVAQAFHWFEPAPALHEMARILRPGGVLALVWNERETGPAWTVELNRIMHGAGDAPHQPVDQLRRTFDGDLHFTAFSRWTGHHDVAMDASEVEDMVASRSYVRVLAEHDRRSVLAQVRRLIASLPRPLVMPYTTVAYCAEVRPGPCPCR
jgi:SAM-dependent methyltransferase